MTLNNELPDEAVNKLATIKDNRDERDQYISALRRAGWTLKSVADASGLSRERVRQIAIDVVPDHVDPDLPRPVEVEQEVKPPRVFKEPSDEALTRLKELQPLAQQVRANSPQFRDEAEEYTALIWKVHTDEGVPIIRIARALGVTHGALRFRLARYGYLEPKTGTSRAYTKIKDENRAK